MFLMAPEAMAESASLSGSLWLCTRASDHSQFMIAFYAGGGVGGGAIQAGEVSPYVFDASGMAEDQWPGRWQQQESRFTWEFPDQHMRITGTISAAGHHGAKLTGAEVTSGMRSAVTCARRSKRLRIGEGLVIPRDGHFMNVEGEEGVLKVPIGISFQQPPAR